MYVYHTSIGGAGDSTAISYLSEALKNSGTNDVVQHGACLGVGLAAMATGDEVREGECYLLTLQNEDRENNFVSG
jgi:adenylylsulfate kinase-like enzyme